MDRAPVTAAVAARQLGCTATAVRGWVRAGAPCIKRTRPLLVEVEALRAWRAGQHADVPERIATALLDTLRRDAGNGQPAHRALGIPDRSAAVLALFAFDRLCRELTGKESATPLPEPVRALRVIAGLPADPP